MNNGAGSVRPPYSGSQVSLIISIDFGTTFSGASWVLLDPGQVPQIWDVSRFDEQLHLQMSKVPTVLFYDKEGNLRATGSETLNNQTIDEAKEQEWLRVEWFKLLLRPDDLAHRVAELVSLKIPPNKKLVHVISDFLRYIATKAQVHFRETLDGRGKIWEEVENKVIYVLSHPNGWNTSQHQTMREAMILAGLIPDTDEGQNRITFVSEGEASLHWCMNKGIGRRDLKVGSRFIVVDAGGGTIDISAFETVKTVPPEFKEYSNPDCRLQGSVFVTRGFEKYIQGKLTGSSYNHSKFIQRMVANFDSQVKHNFRDSNLDRLVRFGEPNDNDPDFGIKSGMLQIQGSEMAQLFKPACGAIVSSVRDQVAHDKTTPVTVVLVGGFSGNLYLFEEVKRRLLELNIQDLQVLRGGDAADKASANGGICFYLDRTVSARMAKWTYGVSCVHDFDQNDPKHVQRQTRVKTNPVTGKQFIEGGFFVTLEKGTLVQDAELTRFPFWHSQSERTATTLELVLECYRGNVPNIKFRDEDDERQFGELCSFKAHIPVASLVRIRKKKRSFFSSSEYYYVSNFHIVVSFGATEFKCYIEWKNKKDKIERGPITPVWEEG